MPNAVAVMDAFHVVRLAGDALDDSHRRVQQQIYGHRGHKGDLLYGASRTRHTGLRFLTDRQGARADAPFADERHAAVEVTWEFYRRLVTGYRETDRTRGEQLMQQLMGSIGSDVPRALQKIGKFCRTLKRRAADVLAYFDRPGTSNGPTEAINGRLEHLSGAALGFRRLTNYIARLLLEAGGSRSPLHPRSR